MATRLTPRNTWLLVVSGLLALAVVAALMVLNGLGAPVFAVARAAGLLGYLAVFLASLSSLYLRELTRYFGRPFIKTHHIVSVSGLILLALHAVAVALGFGSLGVFVPRVDSLRVFLGDLGRIAIWLIAIASLVALFRASLGQNWRLIHWLNYLGFLMGTVHAQLVGTDLALPGVRIVSGAMALALVGVFVVKRVREAQVKRKARSRGGKATGDQD